MIATLLVAGIAVSSATSVKKAWKTVVIDNGLIRVTALQLGDKAKAELYPEECK